MEVADRATLHMGPTVVQALKRHGARLSSQADGCGGPSAGQLVTVRRHDPVQLESRSSSATSPDPERVDVGGLTPQRSVHHDPATQNTLFLTVGAFLETRRPGRTAILASPSGRLNDRADSGLLTVATAIPAFVRARCDGRAWRPH